MYTYFLYDLKQTLDFDTYKGTIQLSLLKYLRN